MMKTRYHRPALAIMSVVLVMAAAGCAGADKTKPSAVASKSVAQRVPVARTLGTGFWQAMRIKAEESAPTALYTYDDVAFSKESSPARASFDLRVLLTDRRSGQPIPYAEVTSTIKHKGKVVFSGRELGTITQTGMSDYEADVKLPGPGTYTLSVLVDSPLASRHLEDAPNHMWKPGQSHRVVSTFVWK